MGNADPGEQQAKVVVHLGDGSDRRPRIPRRRLLIDRDRRRQTLDEIDIGFVHLPEELTGIRRQRLDIAALTFGIDRVEGQRRLARPGQAGEDDQLLARQVDIDVLEVVFSRASNGDRVAHRFRLSANLRSYRNRTVCFDHTARSRLAFFGKVDP